MLLGIFGLARFDSWLHGVSEAELPPRSFPRVGHGQLSHRMSREKPAHWATTSTNTFVGQEPLRSAFELDHGAGGALEKNEPQKAW